MSLQGDCYTSAESKISVRSGLTNLWTGGFRKLRMRIMNEAMEFT